MHERSERGRSAGYTPMSPNGEPLPAKHAIGRERMTTTTPITVTIDDVYAARDRLASLLPRTPLFSSRTLSQMTGTTLRLKAENLQRTGSFKVRGALNAVLQLSPEQKSRGVVTFSAGNHGQALAYAATASGVRCTVFMAE